MMGQGSDSISWGDEEEAEEYCHERDAEDAFNDIQASKQRYNVAKTAETGTTFACPACSSLILKRTYNRMFCNSKGVDNCKDVYWNNVRSQDERDPLMSRGLQRYTTLLNKQHRELTPDMVEYDSDTCVIRIIAESKTEFTCTIRHILSTGKGPDLTVVFPRKHNQGAIWRFMPGKCDRMQYLAIKADHPGLVNHRF